MSQCWAWWCKRGNQKSIGSLWINAAAECQVNSQTSDIYFSFDGTGIDKVRKSLRKAVKVEIRCVRQNDRIAQVRRQRLGSCLDELYPDIWNHNNNNNNKPIHTLQKTVTLFFLSLSEAETRYISGRFPTSSSNSSSAYHIFSFRSGTWRYHGCASFFSWQYAFIRF